MGGVDVGMANPIEFWCPYCQAWITDIVHEQHHHNDSDYPDEIRDWRTRRHPTSTAPSKTSSSSTTV